MGLGLGPVDQPYSDKKRRVPVVVVPRTRQRLFEGLRKRQKGRARFCRKGKENEVKCLWET